MISYINRKVFAPQKGSAKILILYYGKSSSSTLRLSKGVHSMNTLYLLINSYNIYIIFFTACSLTILLSRSGK
jgi:hypothetical protein